MDFWTGDLHVTNFNKTNVSLIPKILSPSDLADFQPISPYNVVCKIIAKVLACRIKLVLPSLIGMNKELLSPLDPL